MDENNRLIPVSMSIIMHAEMREQKPMKLWMVSRHLILSVQRKKSEKRERISQGHIRDRRKSFRQKPPVNSIHRAFCSHMHRTPL